MLTDMVHASLLILVKTLPRVQYEKIAQGHSREANIARGENWFIVLAVVLL